MGNKYDKIDKALEREERIAQDKLASGEIDVDEYNQMIADLERDARAELSDREEE